MFIHFISFASGFLFKKRAELSERPGADIMARNNQETTARIKNYADLLKQQQNLKAELTRINGELLNLAVDMSNDDINRANDLFKILTANH